MRHVMLAAAAAASLLLSGPANAAAGKIAIDEPCPAGYNDHAHVAAGGHEVHVCTIP